MELTLDDGSKLIRFARDNIEFYLEHRKELPIPKDLQEKFSDMGGAFVTLSKGPSHDLRGCIGYIMPVFPLIETIHKVSLSAAFDDPRFPKVRSDEMDTIYVEVSVLSIPKKVEVSSPEEYLEKIVIGRDGLIATKGNHRGLLLPQVPVEHGRNWDVETFLGHTCQKAWLSPDAWKKLKKTKIESFTATIFEEVTPRGDVRQKQIGE